MLQQIDASRLYHSIRGQSVIKLYVIFNVFEVIHPGCFCYGYMMYLEGVGQALLLVWTGYFGFLLFQGCSS